MKFITIVVCAYNESLNIYNCLKSLATIDYPANKFEVIIIDDDSEDETLDIIKKFILENKHINFKFYKIKHGGLSIARNTGVFYSSGEIVFFIDADAIADKNVLKAYNSAFENTNLIIATGKVNNLNYSNKISEFIFLLHNYPSMKISKNRLIGTNMAFRKEILKKYLFFDNFISRGDEFALYYSIKKDFPSLETQYVDNAAVSNETAESIFTWLKKMYIEGSNNTILSNYFNNNNSKNFLFFIIKLGSLVFYLLLILNFMFIKFFFTIPFFIMFIARYSTRFRYMFMGTKKILLKKGFIYAIIALITSTVGIISSDLGSCISFIKGNKLNKKSSIGEIILESKK